MRDRDVRDDARRVDPIGAPLERELGLEHEVAVAEQHLVVAERQEHRADRGQRDAADR